MVERSTSEQTASDKPTLNPSEPPKPSKYDISLIMAEMGRRGGQIGGKRRLETMTKTQRSKVAKKAAQARWAKK